MSKLLTEFSVFNTIRIPEMNITMLHYINSSTQILIQWIYSFTRPQKQKLLKYKSVCTLASTGCVHGSLEARGPI